MIRRSPAVLAPLASALLLAPSAHGQQGELEFYNGFDPEKPTIVAVHGWFGTIDFADTFGRSPSFTQRANVIGWEWDAVFFINITGKARQSGRLLAGDLAAVIMTDFPDYDQPIQLVGHSLGTHVVLEAGAELREIGRDDPNYLAYQADQITLVDTGFNEDIPAAIDDVANDYLVPLKLDNYFSPFEAGGTGSAYEGPLVNVRAPLTHGDIWNWYFTTLDGDPMGPIEPGAPYGQVGPYADLDLAPAAAYMIMGQDTPLDISDDRFLRF